MSTSNGKKIVVGTVTAVYQPGWRTSKKGDDYLAGGKVLIDSKEGVCEISFMQLFVDSERTEDMPEVWNNMDGDIKGRTVAIACSFDKDYTHPATGVTKHQYKNPTDIQYLDGDEFDADEDAEVGSTPTPAPKVSPTPPSISEEKMQIMRQSTLGYSATLLAGKEFASPELMMVRTIQVGRKFLEYVITGEMPSFDEEAEVEDDVIGEA